MSASIQVLAFVPAGNGRRSADPLQARWLSGLYLLDLGAAPLTDHTGDHECALLVLSGTHDFQAGGKAWPQRGVRASPFAGRPVLLFVPPQTPISVAGGAGEALLVCARRPRAKPDAPGKTELSRRPVLTLAGSGKAFDPATGTWRPEEHFALAAEFLLPRHIERVDVGGVAVERLMGGGYKSAVLAMDEAVLHSGGELRTAPPAHAGEAVVYYRSEGELVVRGAGGTATVQGEGALYLAQPAAASFAASGGRSYLALVYAGEKPST
ncbi:MAG: 5-deoxy-glucuronate isomerase [Planctomycetes bacterium]|nr:5-deoxy-glucuronate isomerase [Planctomycetota bacterium]